MAVPSVPSGPADSEQPTSSIATTGAAGLIASAVRSSVDDWVLLWWPRREVADIYYIGTL